MSRTRLSGLLVAAAAAWLLGAAGRSVAEDAVPRNGVAQATNAFALDLLRELRSPEGNLFFSPYSLEAALAMTAEGARGETAAQLRKALHLPNGDAGPAFAQLNQALANQALPAAAKEKPGYQLTVANSLWGQKDFGFLPAFLAKLKDQYGAGLREVDYIGDREAARRAINAWVEQATHDKIKDLIQPPNLTPLTRLVLANAIYFKGAWAEPFKKERTQPGPFTATTGGKPVQVPFMFQRHSFGYAQSDALKPAAQLQILELPYKGGALSMVVLLPALPENAPAVRSKFREPLDVLLDDLTGKGGTWNLLAGLKKQDVEVYLPKFTLTSQFELSKPLAALGLSLPFSDAADFSGMNGKRDLHIGAVAHKAFVDVNEEGTEAAAATGVMIEAMSMPPPAPIFRADRPFLFLIRDVKSGAILFLGRVLNPAAAAAAPAAAPVPPAAPDVRDGAQAPQPGKQAGKDEAVVLADRTVWDPQSGTTVVLGPDGRKVSARNAAGQMVWQCNLPGVGAKVALVNGRMEVSGQQGDPNGPARPTVWVMNLQDGKMLEVR